MSKFTQGEWKVIQGAGLDELDVISEDKKDICCLFGYSISRWEEQKANARLIVAAPEMYRLLESIVSLLSVHSYSQGEAVKIHQLLARIDGEEAEHD